MRDQDTTAIKCQGCGAPSYFDQQAEGFVCPNCGNFAPWAAADYRYTLNKIFRHSPIPLVDGLIKLTHVGTGETTVRDLRAPHELEQRTSSLDDLPDLLRGTFGLKEVKLQTWVTNLRRHKYATVNLPVWYLDKPSWTGASDLQARIAENAQTGKAAALFLQAGHKDYTRTLDIQKFI